VDTSSSYLLLTVSFYRTDLSIQRIRKIAALSCQYRKMFEDTAPSYQNNATIDQIKNDWWLALINFFDRIFYQGRSDELSGRFEKVTLDALVQFFGSNKNQRLKKIVQYGNQGFLDYKKYGFTPKYTSSTTGHSSVLQKSFNRKDWPYTTPRGINIKSGLGRGRDKEMVLNTLHFISTIPQYGHNVLSYSIDHIQNNKIPKLFKSFDEIRSVGVKTASFFIRDTVAFYGLETPTFVYDKYTQPIDTWVRQVCKKLHIVAKNDNILVNKIVQHCKVAGVSPIKFNQGCWYLGSHSLELIFQGFTL